MFDMIRNLFNRLTKHMNATPEELWLSQSADVCELEHRLRQLNHKQGTMFANFNPSNHVGGLI